MTSSILPVLDQIARQGSWYGGGSAAALTCATAAALLEKLLCPAGDVRRLRALRRRCTGLIDDDARTFSMVIHAYYQCDAALAKRRLRAAIRIPAEICRASEELLARARRDTRLIKPRYRVDLRCAMELAKAAGVASRALVETNLAWLDEPAFARRIRRTLRAR